MNPRLQGLLPFLVIFCGLLAYINSFRGVFLLDDHRTIANSKTIEDMRGYIGHSSRPLTALSFHLNHRLSGIEPTDYHAFNLLIHLGAALLLYGVARRTLESPLLVERYGSSSRFVAVSAAILWAVHPVQTQSVTYIVQRAESMMGLFYLLALYCFLRGMQAERSGAPWFFGAVAACGLGMASKAVMATAPLVVLLYDRTFHAGSFRNAWRLRWRAHAGMAATWGILALLMLRPHESSASAGFSMDSVTPLGYLATQPGVIVHYLKLVVWPRNLCLDYAWPPALGATDVVGPAILVGLSIVLAGVLAWKKHPAGFCLAWFFVILAPSSSIVPIADYAFEHRLYLPLAGLMALAAGVVAMPVRRRPVRRTFGLPAAAVSAFVVALMACALTVRTVERNRDYASSIEFARTDVRLRPHNFRARMRLVGALMTDFDFSGAEDEAKRLIIDVERATRTGGRLYSLSASNPGYYLPLANRAAGVALLSQDRNAEALPFFVRALALRPDLHAARNNLGVALFGLGRLDEALGEVMRVLASDPESGDSHTLAGFVLARKGQPEKAIAHLERAVSIHPRSVVAALELAWLLATVPDEALRDGPRAVELAERVGRLTRGGNHRSLDVLAAARAECGEFELAEATALRALRISRERHDAGRTGDVGGGASAVRSAPDEIEERIRSYRNRTPWRRP